MIKDSKLFCTTINTGMTYNPNIFLTAMPCDKFKFTAHELLQKRSMEELLKERENDLNNNIFEKTIENPIEQDPLGIQSYIENRDDSDTYYENINDMKNAEQKSPINYKIKMKNTYINNIIFTGVFSSVFLVQYKNPTVTLKFVSEYKSSNNDKNFILLPSDFKFEEKSVYKFNCNIQFIISTDRNEYNFKYNKICKMSNAAEKCDLLKFKTSSKNNDYSSDLEFYYNKSNHSMSFKSCDIVLSETTFYDMGLPI